MNPADVQMTIETNILPSVRLMTVIEQSEAQGIYNRDWRAHVRIFDPVMTAVLDPTLQEVDRSAVVALQARLNQHFAVRKTAGDVFTLKQSQVFRMCSKASSYLRKLRPKPDFRISHSLIDKERRLLAKDWQYLRRSAGLES